MKRKVGTDRLVGTILKNPRTNIRAKVSLDVDFGLPLSENMGKDVKKYQMHLTFNFFFKLI